MGNSSQGQKGGEDEEPRVNDPRKIYFDDSGNLRYGHEFHDRDEELRRILAADDTEELDGKEWYIVSDAWMKAWLSFVHYDRECCPAPGPCRNDILLIVQSDEQADGSLTSRYVPRPGLVMASNDRAGDYRRISRDAWDVFAGCYRGSGPAISMLFIDDPQHRKDGLYDTSGWQIDQRSCPAPSGVTKRKKAVLAAAAEKTATALDKTIGGTSTVINEGGTRRGVAAQGGTGNALPPQFNLPHHHHQEVLEDLPLSEENREKINAFFGSSKLEISQKPQESSSRRLADAYKEQKRPEENTQNKTKQTKSSKVGKKEPVKANNKRAASVTPPDITTAPNASEKWLFGGKD